MAIAVLRARPSNIFRKRFLRASNSYMQCKSHIRCHSSSVGFKYSTVRPREEASVWFITDPRAKLVSRDDRHATVFFDLLRPRLAHHTGRQELGRQALRLLQSKFAIHVQRKILLRDCRGI